mmetsp:Transcript_62401/g.71569  ORF Transcript_62401/g.71569 Transcript_62401/m.71569 type:complete len:108 (-) Transcript_62401:1965-2288(-)
MYILHFFVEKVARIPIKDTQCGFKLYTRRTAQKLFQIQHIERWAFDLELIYLCQKLHIPVSEVAVNWREIPGSKVDIVFDSIQIARDLLLIIVYYGLNLWKISDRVH